MKTDRELLEQALKLVAKYHARETILVEWEKSVIEAINARLNERESSDEPVAWRGWDKCGMMKFRFKAFDGAIPLYRHPPPARKLTDEEIKTLWVENLITVSEEQGCIRFARAIERRINGEEE